MELTVRSCILWEPQKQQTPVQVRWAEDEPPGPKSSCKAKQKWDFVERLTKLPNDFSFKDIRFFQPFSPFENLFRSLKLFYIINCVIKLNSCKDLQRLQKSKKGFEKLKIFFDFLNFFSICLILIFNHCTVFTLLFYIQWLYFTYLIIVLIVIKI